MMIRHTTSLAVVFFLAFSFIQCRSEKSPPAKDDAANAEELPKEIAANLKQVPNTDLLVSVPPVGVKVPDTARTTLPAAKSCMTTQSFSSYCFYRVTTCSRYANFGTVLTEYLAMTGPVPSPDSALVKTFKLSSFAGRTFDRFLVCDVRDGPWNAIIVKQTDCSDVTRCTMTLGCLGCPVFQWSGPTCESTDRPAEVRFFGDLAAGASFQIRRPIRH
jgi:hypothetical protein